MIQVEIHFTEKYENDDDAIFDGVYTKQTCPLIAYIWRIHGNSAGPQCFICKGMF